MLARLLAPPRLRCIRDGYCQVRHLLFRALLPFAKVRPILRGMSIHLPPAIDLYVKAENSGQVQALSECFAPNATVRDEGRTYKGLAAIKEWKAETKKKYNHTVAPLEIVGTCDRRTDGARDVDAEDRKSV